MPSTSSPRREEENHLCTPTKNINRPPSLLSPIAEFDEEEVNNFDLSMDAAEMNQFMEEYHTSMNCKWKFSINLSEVIY